MRDFFFLQTMKGGSYSACWGIDLAFAPKCANSALRSKAPLKQVVGDLIIDPVDDTGQLESWHSVSTSDKPSNRCLSKLARDTCSAALEDLDAMQSLADVDNCFVRRNALQFRRFSLEHYVQTDLAWGLTLHALGRPTEGDSKLDRFCLRFEIPRDNPTLAKAVDAAIHIGEKVQ